MELTPSQKKTVRHQFDSFCRKVLREEARDYERHIAWRSNHEVSLSELSEEQERQMYVLDEYPSEQTHFHVQGYDAVSYTHLGHDFRDCIAPDCISFQKNHYELGDHVGRTLFLREYASFISDEMITELMDYPRNMMLSIDIIPVAMDEAVSDIRKRIMSVESDITRWQQRQNQNNNFTANIPYDLEQMRSETKEFMTDLMSRDQRMMLALVTLTHLADDLEQLDQDTEALQAIGRAPVSYTHLDVYKRQNICWEACCSTAVELRFTTPAGRTDDRARSTAALNGAIPRN